MRLENLTCTQHWSEKKLEILHSSENNRSKCHRIYFHKVWMEWNEAKCIQCTCIVECSSSISMCSMRACVLLFCIVLHGDDHFPFQVDFNVLWLYKFQVFSNGWSLHIEIIELKKFIMINTCCVVHNIQMRYTKTANCVPWKTTIYTK